MMNKKGNAQDVLLMMAILFAFGLGLFIMHFTSTTMITALLNQTQINQSAATVAALQGVQHNVVDRMDYIYFSVFIALALTIIITGWFISGHPIFVPIYFIVIVIVVALSAVLANAWELVTQRPVFVSTLAAFPTTNHILLYLPYYMAVIGMIGLIVTFAKPYIADGQSSIGVGGGHL